MDVEPRQQESEELTTGGDDTQGYPKDYYAMVRCEMYERDGKFERTRKFTRIGGFIAGYVASSVIEAFLIEKGSSKCPLVLGGLLLGITGRVLIISGNRVRFEIIERSGSGQMKDLISEFKLIGKQMILRYTGEFLQAAGAGVIIGSWLPFKDTYEKLITYKSQ